MKKPYILLASIAACVLVFFLLLTVFKGVKNYIVNQYKIEYITPSPKDSLYMELLNDMDTRSRAMSISKEVQDFYFLTDSLKTILDAKISSELIFEIIGDKELDKEVRNHLYYFDTTTVINCIPFCLDSIEMNNEDWLKLSSRKEAKEVRDHIQEKINKVVEAEKNALQKIKAALGK